MASHAPPARTRADRKATDRPSARTAEARRPRCLGPAAQLAEVHRTLRGGLARLEAAGPASAGRRREPNAGGGRVADRFDGGARSQGVVQAKLIYPKADFDVQKAAFNEFAGDESTLRNAAEPRSIEALAGGLGQTLTWYETGKPTDIAGERLNYMVGHVGFGAQGLDDPYWGSVGPKQIAQDFVAGLIQPGSTLKIIGCKGAVSLGPQLAAEFDARGAPNIAVIASTGIVHATGAGITAFPDRKAEMSKEQITVFNQVKKKNDASNSRTRELIAQAAPIRAEIDRLRQEYFSLPEEQQQDAVVKNKYKGLIGTARMPLAPIKAEFDQLTREFFDFSVNSFNAFHGKGGSPFATIPAEGWLKFIGTAGPADLTEADQRHAPPVAQQPQLGAPQLQIPLPQPQGAVPQPQVPLPQPQGAVPQPQVPLPQPQGAIPQPQIPLPQPQGPVPQPQVGGAQPLVFVDATDNHPLM